MSSQHTEEVVLRLSREEVVIVAQAVEEFRDESAGPHHELNRQLAEKIRAFLSSPSLEEAAASETSGNAGTNQPAPGGPGSEPGSEPTPPEVERLSNAYAACLKFAKDKHEHLAIGELLEAAKLRYADATLFAEKQQLQIAAESSLDEGEREREIWINRGRFVVRGEAMQGDALRNIPTPPISENDDLFQVTVRSSEPDLLVRPDRLVDFKAGVEFFSAPKTIQAGND